MSDITLTSAVRQNLSQLRATATLLDKTQNRLATGKKINSALDDPTAFFKAKGLSDSANDLAALKDDMGQSISTIQSADEAITSITALIDQAKSLANSAKSSSVASDRADLAQQFDDILIQIDQLSSDATYSGVNLVNGRGTVTGGAFTDDSSTAETAFTGVITGGIARTGTDTGVGAYAFTLQQQVQAANLALVGQSTDTDITNITDDFISQTDVASDDTLSFELYDQFGSVAATATITMTAATTVSLIGTLLIASAVGTHANMTVATPTANTQAQLTFTSTDGYTLRVVDGGTNSLNLANELGLNMGFQSGTGVTTDLGVTGGRINIYTEGYTRDTGSSLTVLVSGSDLVFTDGNDTVTVAFSSFSTDSSTLNAGTLYTTTINDMTINIGVTGDLSALTDTNSITAVKNKQAGTATGDFQVVVTSGGATVTTNIDTTSTTTVSISDSAFGTTFAFKGDDAAMIAGETSTVNVTNPTGVGTSDLSVTFNADGTSTINVKAVDISSSGLSVLAASGSWATDTNVNVAITALDAAKTLLRANSKGLATSLGIVQTREEFTSSFIDNLRVGSDKLTLADGTEEATNLLVLQTRQQLGIQALSIASQSSQSILILFQ